MRFYRGTAMNQPNSAGRCCLIYLGKPLCSVFCFPCHAVLICSNLKRPLNPECTHTDCGLPQARTAHQHVVPDCLPCLRVTNVAENK